MQATLSPVARRSHKKAQLAAKMVFGNAFMRENIKIKCLANACEKVILWFHLLLDILIRLFAGSRGGNRDCIVQKTKDGFRVKLKNTKTKMLKVKDTYAIHDTKNLCEAMTQVRE